MYDPYMYDSFDMMGDDSFLLLFMGIYLAVLAVMLLYAIFVYILNAVGLHTMAKRRGINHPWLAWLPIGNTWILGSISDQYQYVAKGKNRSRRKLLLGLQIGTIAAVILFYILYFVLFFNLMEEMMYYQDVATVLGYFGWIFLLILGLAAVAIVNSVFIYIAYYDLFVSSRPKAAVVFLILGIIFSFLLPYFVFACRKKDDGMPPRRVPTQPQAPVQLQSAPVQQPEQPVGPADVIADESDFEEE